MQGIRQEFTEDTKESCKDFGGRQKTAMEFKEGLARGRRRFNKKLLARNLAIVFGPIGGWVPNL